MLHRLGVQVSVEKHGIGKAKVWVEVTPPWPDDVEWWGELFSPEITGPYALGADEPDKGSGGGLANSAVTSVVALVLAAIGSNTASQ